MEKNGTQIWGTVLPPVTSNNFSSLGSTTIDMISEQINAGWFIIVVIGFFAFVIISSMVVNQLNAEPVEDDLFYEFVEKPYHTKKKSTKSPQQAPQCYLNQAYTDSCTGTTSEHLKGVENAKKTKRDNEIPAANQDAVICISAVS